MTTIYHSSVGETPRERKMKRRARETGRIIPGMMGYGAWMICQVCGQRWGPMIQPGGRMPRGWRECPNGCTRDQMGTVS